ncbi:nucleoside-diphosphate-sugar epimerase [Nocardia transvalensis]|uniref:Nucleoside-diphosphate-sugar epimerase n=1 Tax=Nocardia transvalensis TaxID=37333 RepID=A0A7W9ULL5_9NOCA|nr:NAD-dependent epimerase/dehydratase family protein [Nocardia transvalensis]MBB5916845.1 nucleoside-diphosphate-sugar epimerase [Nocardia transvalensis]
MTRVLILGGSWFLGREIAEQAVARGWEVTTFRRGRSGADVDGVTTIRGDRTEPDDLKRLAAAGVWDLVVDTSSFVPRETLQLARALAPVATRYVLVSTVSVYAGWPVEPLDESSEVLDCPTDAGPDYGYDGDPGPSTYGFGKAGCERAIVETFGPERTSILRPGVILGPREYVGRLEWWLRRMRRGGRVLAPGRPDRSIQPVDVRDVAAFALTPALTGVFNLTASGRETFGQMLDACREVTGREATTTWITDEKWLMDQGVQQWTELPLWRIYRGAWAVDSQRARDAGFTTRSIRDTVSDTWGWLAGGGHAIAHERASELGISPQREQALLGLWDSTQLDHCGGD